MPRAERNIYTQSTHTRCFVAFYTHAQNGPSFEEPIASHPSLGTLTSCTTDKQLGSASGTFSLTFKKDQQLGPISLLRLWREPEDVWVRIYFEVDGQRIDTMLGMIDSIQESTVRSGLGQKNETYTITGRDFGKVFETTELFVNFYHDPQRVVQSVAALVNTALEEVINTPEGFLRVLLDFWIGNNGAAEQQWSLPEGLGGGFFSNILSKQIQEMEPLVNGECISPSLFQIDQTGGKLWDVLQEYSNGVLNELFVDLGPAGGDPNNLQELQPCIYLRERPFPTFDTANNAPSRRKWDQLRTRVLERGDVQARNLAKGGAAQRFNYWQIQLEGIGTEGFGVQEILQRGVDGVDPGFPGNIPIYSTEGIAKHGLRRYMLSTRYIPYQAAPQAGATEQSDRENFFRLAALFLKKAHDWYAPATYELSGRITTTRVMPEIRVGERLEEQREEGKIHYYVEGVTNTWNYPQNGSTQLTVTRGEYEDDNILERVYEQYDNPLALTGREACFIEEGTELDEALDQLRQGCAFAVATPDEAGFTVQGAEGAGLVADSADLEQAGQRVLASETPDGRGTPELGGAAAGEDLDTQMVSTLDDSLPLSIGDEAEIPPAGELGTPEGEPVLDQGRLERGEPIEVLEGLDEPGVTDPLAGLEGI